MFVDAGRDPRRGPAIGDERTLLVDSLRSQRATLELRCAGLGEELARRAVAPSTLSLLGLVRHLADVERRWSRGVLAGEAAAPRLQSVNVLVAGGSVPRLPAVGDGGDAGDRLGPHVSHLLISERHEKSIHHW
jgi:hypothetical protein